VVAITSALLVYFSSIPSKKVAMMMSSVNMIHIFLAREDEVRLYVCPIPLLLLELKERVYFVLM
jgi:hypothetical protein